MFFVVSGTCIVEKYYKIQIRPAFYSRNDFKTFIIFPVLSLTVRHIFVSEITINELQIMF